MKYKCPECNGIGEVLGDVDYQGVAWGDPCSMCVATGKVDRFVRWPIKDRRIARGDDFAGDAFLDMELKSIRYVAVGRTPVTGEI